MNQFATVTWQDVAGLLHRERVEQRYTVVVHRWQLERFTPEAVAEAIDKMKRAGYDVMIMEPIPCQHDWHYFTLTPLPGQAREYCRCCVECEATEMIDRETFERDKDWL